MTPSEITLDWLYARVVERDGCLIWTGATGARGTQPQAKIDDKTQNVRRVIWSLVHGKKVPKGWRVGSTCEHQLCIHPDCLIARRNGALLLGKKQSLLQRTRNAQGQRRRSKIGDDGVEKIVAGEMGPEEFIEKYGMSRSYFHRIRNGEFRRDYSSPFAGLVV
jgi:hypothetical protein